MHVKTMPAVTVGMLFGVLSLWSSKPVTAREDAPKAPATKERRIDLAKHLAAGKLRAVNRDIRALAGGASGVHVGEGEGPGVVWIEDVDFADGAIEVDVRGRDVLQRSFLGLAFHRADDRTYDAVYLRPFNFRATDPVRRDHAVQYVSMPDYDWPRLRRERPEEFENPVDPSLDPAGWVRLRVVVNGPAIRVHAGPGSAPVLEVQKLGRQGRGAIGLWTGNGSDGDFDNLRIIPAE
jgi:hypothetical protein